MLDLETIIQIFFIVFAAMALFTGAWKIADNFDTWGDFFKMFKDKGYSYLFFVFRKGKHLCFITDFPTDLRNACLGKNSFYMETEEDKNPKKAKQREAKRLVRVVLTSDDLINEYFRGQCYKNFPDIKTCHDRIGDRIWKREITVTEVNGIKESRSQGNGMKKGCVSSFVILTHEYEDYLHVRGLKTNV